MSDSVKPFQSLYDEMAREKIFYPAHVIKEINNVLADRNPEHVIDSCLNILETGVYARVSNYLNSFFVSKIESSLTMRLEKKTQQINSNHTGTHISDVQAAKVSEANPSGGQEETKSVKQSKGSENKVKDEDSEGIMEMINIEKRILDLSDGGKPSFGHYLEGLRIFLTSDYLIEQLDKLNIAYPNWSNKINAKGNGKNQGDHEQGIDSIVVDAIIEFYHYSIMIEKGVGFGVAPDKLESYVKSEKIDRNKQISWNDVLSRVITLRNRKNHNNEESWWRNDSYFGSLVKDLIAPFTLALLLHKEWKSLICLENALIKGFNDLDHGRYRCNLDRLDANELISAPNPFSEVSSEEYQSLKSSQSVIIRGSLVYSENRFDIILNNIWSFPTVDNRIWDEYYSFLRVYLYLRDGFYSHEEEELFKSIEQLWPISKSIQRMHGIKGTIKKSKSKGKGSNKAAPNHSEEPNSLLYGRTQYYVMEIEKNLRSEEGSEQKLKDFLFQIIPSLKDESHFSSFKKSLCTVLNITAIKRSKGVSGNDDFEESLAQGITSESVTLGFLLDSTRKLFSVQSTFLRDHLMNANGVQNLESIAKHFKLPETLIVHRLNMLTSQGSMLEEQQKDKIQIVQVDHGYTTKDHILIKRFSDTFKAVKDAFGEIKDPPPYVFELLEIAAEYIRNEDHNPVWVDQVGALRRRYLSDGPNIKFTLKGENAFKTEGRNIEMLWGDILKHLNSSIVTKEGLDQFNELRLIGNRVALRRSKSEGSEDLGHLKIGKLKFEFNRTLESLEFAYTACRFLEQALNLTHPEYKGQGPDEKRLMLQIDSDDIDLLDVHEIGQVQTLDPEGKAHRPGRAQVHLKLQFVHEGKTYVKYIREDSLTTIYANILYSLNISEGWLDELKGQKDQTEVYDRIVNHALFENEDQEKYIPTLSLWAGYERALAEQRNGTQPLEAWPILTGRVRCMFNSIPFHTSGSEFVSPRLYRLGQEYGEAPRPPIDYYFDVAGTTKEHTSQIKELCKRFNVDVDEVEFYPVIRFNGQVFNFISGDRVQVFIDYMSTLLATHEPKRTEDALYHCREQEHAWFYPGTEKSAWAKHRKFLLSTEQTHFDKNIGFENGVLVSQEGSEHRYYVDKALISSQLDIKLIETLHTLLFDQITVELDYVPLSVRDNGVTGQEQVRENDVKSAEDNPLRHQDSMDQNVAFDQTSQVNV